MLRSFILRHIILFRFLALWIIPVAMLVIPGIAYVIDSRAGVLPDRHEWEIGHQAGAGPWSGSFVELALLALGFIGVVGSAVGVFIARRHGGLVGPWIAHTALVLIAAYADFALFGWLID